MKHILARLLSLSVLAATPLALGDVVNREGSGARRDALNAMELKPFPAELWSKLSDWTGKPIASADTSGQVVIVMTWSGWYQPAVRALGLAKRLANDHAKDGLVVVAVHNPEGWKDAEKPTANADAKFFVAHDAAGEFRKALMVDQDPDFYVIDRAGQLRYADITTESVEEAAKILLAETTEKAAGLNKELAAAKAKTEEDFRHTGAIRQEVDIRALPDVPFTDPTPEAYASVTWPKKEKSTSSYEASSASSVTLPQDGWFPSKPQTKGRVVVVYAFSPYIRQTYEQIMPSMDLLQRQNGRDIVVVGSLVPVRPDNQRGDEGKEDPAAVARMAKQFAAARTLEHSILADGGSAAGFSSSSSNSLPYVVIASSDGVVRWTGDPRSPSFRPAVEQILRVDPGVKARRAAEDQFLKNKK